LESLLLVAGDPMFSRSPLYFSPFLSLVETDDVI